MNDETNVLGPNDARLGVTYDGKYADLRDPVPFDATDAQVVGWATESIQSGTAPGIPAIPTADLSGFVVERFTATPERPLNLIQVRPKVPFGVSLL